jgi:hypothetical protein
VHRWVGRVTGDNEALRRALFWAAGRPGEQPPEVDEDALFAALDEHRLDGRFLRRVSTATAPAFSADLVTAVRDRHVQVTRRVDVQVDTARQLASDARAAASDDELLLLKGFSLYALTGDRLTMRRSGDLDVMAADLDGFVARALAAGYQTLGEPDQLAEYAVLHHPDHGPVDLHSYFPVTHVPAGLPPSQYDAGANTGRWQQSAPFLVHKLRHADLREHRSRSVAPPLEPLAILGPEMLALVYASHFFADYIMNLLPLPVATVRLDEVATIVDLTRLPSFRPHVLDALAEHYDGQHVLAMAARLARELLGIDLFAGTACLDGTDAVSFPRDLWWDGVDGFPVDLGWDAGETAVRDTGMSVLLNRLGANATPVRPLGPSARIGALTGRPTDAGRYVYRRVAGCGFAVECDVAAGAHTLDLTVRMPGAGPDEMSGLSLNFGDHRFEFFYKPAIGHFRADDYSNLLSADNGIVSDARTADGHDVFTVSIPWKTLGDPLQAAAPVPLLLGARQQKREWGRMTGGAILPLFLDITA